MNMSVRIRDVARRAGVSVGTVSNVLNGNPTVRPDNLERVQRAMAELGFVPNIHARQLRTGRGQAIGLLVLSFVNPFFAKMAHVAEGVAEEYDATLIVGSSDQNQAREERYIELFEESRVRGLLIAPVQGASDRLRQFHERGTPTVLLDELKPERCCSVAMDGTQAGHLAAQHLLEIGRRRLLVVGGPVQQIADRLSGASQAVQEASGASLSFIATSDLTVAEGRAVGRRLAALPPEDRPDSVFTANDVVGLGILQELMLANIAVPDEIALVGCDDMDFTQTAFIPLTTIAQPCEQIAREAISLLADEADNPDGHVHQHRRLAPELIVRSSSARSH